MKKATRIGAKMPHFEPEFRRNLTKTVEILGKKILEGCGGERLC